MTVTNLEPNHRDVYERYMRSEQWSQLRQRAIERDGGKCRDCGSEYNLEGHHIRYPANLFTEDRLENIKTLCADCHHARHGGVRIGVWDPHFEHLNKDIGLTGTRYRMWKRVSPDTQHVIDYFRLARRRLGNSAQYGPFLGLMLAPGTVDDIIDNLAEVIVYLSRRRNPLTKNAGILTDNFCRFDPNDRERLRRLYRERKNHYQTTLTKQS